MPLLGQFYIVGDIEALVDQFKLVTAYHHNNYRPLLWPAHATNRAVIFRVLDQIKIESATQDKSLLCALNFVRQHRGSRKDCLPADIDLRFASSRWRTFIQSREGTNLMLDRRALEVCVFTHLAEALQGGDLYIEDSGAYSDYRKQLLPWSECQKRLPDYCQSLGLPDSSGAFVTSLQRQLTQVADQIDQQSRKTVSSPSIMMVSHT